MDSAVEGFLAWCRAERGLSENTMDAYSRDLQRLRLFLSKRSIVTVEAVEQADLSAWILDLHESGLAATSIARHRVAMRQLFRFLVDEGILKVNPSELIRAPRAPRKLPGTLNQQEVAALLDAPDRKSPLGLRDAAMLELLYATGLRVSELVGLARPVARWMAGRHRERRQGPVGSLWRPGRGCSGGLHAHPTR
jgi:integrase/recombinase XerD